VSGDLERRSAVHPLELPRLVTGVLTDIRAIAEGMAVLPKLLETLNSIEGRVETLDEEVRLMRARVDSMGGNVGDLRQGIERLEPHLEDVSRVAHPLRRLGQRTRRTDPGA
jgi:hypothetical protein